MSVCCPAAIGNTLSVASWLKRNLFLVLLETPSPTDNHARDADDDRHRRRRQVKSCFQVLLATQGLRDHIERAWLSKTTAGPILS